MAAALAVVYPHMTAIGGDGFWLIGAPGKTPVGIDACGRAAAATAPEFNAQVGLSAISQRGAMAANTTAGTVAGWGEALRLNVERWGACLSPASLKMRSGTPATASP